MSMQNIYSRLSFQPKTLRYSPLFSFVGKWLAVKKEARANSHRLLVAERVSIGEKTFLSVVHVDGRRFLVATAQANVALLTELKPEETFTAAMKNVVDEGKPRVRKPRVSRVKKEGAST